MSLPLGNPIAIFLLVLIIMLCVPLFFRPLKIPYIVGLIIAGMVVGPYGFNLLERDASFTIFGQVGILYLMFLAAVEIDMFHMRKNLRHGLIFGFFTFLIPFAAGVAVMRLAFDSSWVTAVLVASMFSSHTLVSYPIVSRFGLSNNRAAVIAVCGTIVAVLLALLTLAEVVDVRTTGSFHWSGLIWLLVMMVCYAIIIGWLFPIVTRRFFRSVNDPVSQFIFILAMVFVASIFAAVIGLEAILGAFYAGLVLNRFIPSRSALMRNISFVGNAIFIPYFLIGVGMLINVNLVFKGWGVLIAAGAMTVTALLAKLVVTLAARKAFSLTRDEGMLVFGLTSGKAAATIAATMIGFQYGILSEDFMNGAVIMILVCCIVASMATEHSAKKIRLTLAEEELNSDASHSPGFARQVVAVSNPLTADGLVKTALFMRNPDNTELLVNLFVRNNDNASVMTTGRSALQTASKAAASMGVESKEIERFDLNVVAALTNTMHEQEATDIILGMHVRANIVDSFFGSIAENLLKRTDRMVMLVRCFIPVDTVKKIVAFIPRNSEYETGFHSMIARIANLASQLGRRVVFICSREAKDYIDSFINEEGFSCLRSYLPMDSWDDFIILSSQASVDDLFIVCGARKGSISYYSDLDSLPAFLNRHFSRHNIVMIYPAQYAASYGKI